MKLSKFAAMGLGLFACTALALAQDPKAPAAGAGTQPKTKTGAQVKPGTNPPPAAGAPATKPAAAPSGPELTKKASYAIGLGFGQQIKEQELALDPDQVLAGLRAGLTGAKPQMTEAEIETVMDAFREAFIAQQAAKMQAEAAKNAKEGADFLAANKAKPGVQATKSGLQYQVLKPGTGASPKATDVVKVHYKGTLLDGTEFDSSYKTGEPVEFPLNRVIPGWTEGVQLMKLNGQTRLFVPAELAYGEAGSPPAIPPNSTLIFDIELLGITPGAPAPAAAPAGGNAVPKSN
jgi:FKBP-type peptidyl-prolyl cis-trans isomerase